MFASLNPEQTLLFKKYKFNNYVKNIRLTQTQLNEWRTNKTIVDPKPLNDDEIMRIEKATRGQSNNDLWTLLRLDRTTASATSAANSRANNLFQKPALVFGNAQENLVKANNTLMFEHMRAKIVEMCNNNGGAQLQSIDIIETVPDCGMFFSKLGLHAASPDSYFKLSDGTYIPVEIKCPYNYRDTTVEQMRSTLGGNKSRYRVKHTALTVNKFGQPHFEVVTTDPHYRQMQRQMYTMNAPFCFYVVKFKHNLIVKTVRRDEAFCRKECETESKAYVAFAIENANVSRFQQIDQRVRSFKSHGDNHNFNETQTVNLAHRGIYLDYGYLKCVYCTTFNMDSREPYNSVMARVHDQCTGVPLKQDKFDNPSFFDHTKRYRSLLKSTQHRECAESIAYFGYYMDENNEIKTFCCAVKSENPTKHNHKPDCAYYLEILK
ncbi:alk-exo [Catopsilia pomona nucleopolyhedrovirus]|uniref:Alk-exo n=1 Tax=Catopsilia pomona nucleopolyhedrovirus TaxID=1850906 RepID=A0A172WZ93_9ABAC|nr:alk-exo [Catopsilia pomona nucleopolyhedrovirus]ANF29669.1 alk-exo [Catopsilia pomona nucleopolyhedrovirus]